MRWFAGLCFGVALALAVGVSAQHDIGGGGHSDVMEGSAVQADGTFQTDGDLDGNDLKNVDDVWSDAVATDAAPRVTVIGSQPINVTPGATNVTGADLVLAGSPGENTLEGVTKANTTGDTLTFSVWSNGVLTSTVKTEGSASPNGWDCDGAASDIECVCNLYALLTGSGAISGVTVTRSDPTCSDEKLTFSITPGTSESLYVATSDDTNVDMTNGTPGRVIIPSYTDDAGGLIFGAEGASTGILLKYDGNFLHVRKGDDSDYKGIACDDLYGSGYVVAGAAEYNGIYSRLKISCSATGVCDFTNWAGQGIQMNFTTDSQLTLTDEVGGALLLNVDEIAHNADEDTIATTGDANPATATLTPTSSYVELTCNDPDTCDITMGETGILEGTKVTIINLSTNACDFSDSAGVSELNAAFAMGQYDTLTLIYTGDTWAEITRSNN